MKTYWKFWTMFHFGSLETWLNQMAKQGWIFQGVRLRYGFMFKKMKPQDIVYRFDYRRYLLEGYMTELFHKNWVMTKINKNWLIWSCPSKNANLQLESDYNEDILKGIKRITVIQLILCVLCWVVPRFVVANELQNPLVMLVYILVCIVMTYNVIRCFYYQAMVEVRQELQ